MTYASSISSGETRGIHMAARLKALSQQRGRPQITISLDGFQDSWVATFSTLDRITGNVEVTCPSDTTVESLDINFIGALHTFVERLSSATAISGRTQAFHQFLKLAQPIPDSAWPTDRILRAGQTYSFRFLFVIPEQLLSRICRHTVSSSTIHQEHLQPPPSLGDCAISGRGNTLLDDFAPDMARIQYLVTATLVPTHAQGQPARPIITTKKIRVMPASDERAPLAGGPETDYTMRVEKDIRKGVFKGKLGRLVVEAAQPKAIKLPYRTSECIDPESTAVTVNLRFDPVEGKNQPPKLGNLTTKLKVGTFFSTTARSQIPSKKDIQWDLDQGVHTEIVNLASRAVSSVEWAFHPATSPSLQRRASSCSSSSESDIEASSKYTGAGYYTARILIPVSLPSNKAWVPTFHSCLVSRVYTISMHLGVGAGTGIDLRIPMQIASEGNPAVLGRRRHASLSLEEQAVEALEADDFFAPHTIRPIDEALIGGSSVGEDALPGYDDLLSSGRNRRSVVV